MRNIQEAAGPQWLFEQDWGLKQPRDLTAGKNSIMHLPSIKEIASFFKRRIPKSIAEEISEFSSLKSLIESSITDTPPLSLRDGGIITKWL